MHTGPPEKIFPCTFLDIVGCPLFSGMMEASWDGMLRNQDNTMFSARSTKGIALNLKFTATASVGCIAVFWLIKTGEKACIKA